MFLGAFHHLLRTIGNAVMKQFERAPIEGFEHFMSLKKIAFFDIGIIVDILVFERERTIRQQQQAIRELSTPVLQIRDRLLLLPIIGVIDTMRARFITESLLRSIRANRAKVISAARRRASATSSPMTPRAVVEPDRGNTANRAQCTYGRSASEAVFGLGS